MRIRTCLAILLLLAPLEAADSAADLQTLIAEVRHLRAALDRTTQIGLRVQLLLHRFHQQQQTLRLVVAQHEQLTERVSYEEGELESARRRLEPAEVELRDTKDPQQKAYLQSQVAHAKTVLREAPQRIAQLRATESDLSAKRRNEELKMQEIERQLEQTEALFATR